MGRLGLRYGAVLLDLGRPHSSLSKGNRPGDGVAQSLARDKYTDPRGHDVEYQKVWLFTTGWGYETVTGTNPNAQYYDGNDDPLMRDPDTGVLYRISNGQKERLYRVTDCSVHPCVTKYVYENDSAFQDYRRHVDTANSQWDGRDGGVVAGIIGGCAITIAVGCWEGAAVGGGGVAVGLTAWAAYREWQEAQQARKLLPSMHDVGAPVSKPRIRS